METIKKWGMWIVGACVFLLSIIAVLGRQKEEPKADSGNAKVTEQEVEKAKEQHDEIVESQKAAVDKVNTPIPPSNAADIDAAIEEWKNT